MSHIYSLGPNRSARRQLERSQAKSQRREEKKQKKNSTNGAKYNHKKCRKIVPHYAATRSEPMLHISDNVSEDIEVIGEIEFEPQTIIVTRKITHENMALDFEKMQLKDKTELAPCFDNLSEITSESSVTADDCLTTLGDDETFSASNQDQAEEASFTSTVSEDAIPYLSSSTEKKKSKASLLKLFSHKNLSKLVSDKA